MQRVGSRESTRLKGAKTQRGTARFTTHHAPPNYQQSTTINQLTTTTNYQLPTTNPSDSTIRVDVELLECVMNLMGELVLARNQIVQFASTLENPNFTATCQQLHQITAFFRDSYPFEALKNFVIPELIARRTTEKSLKIWCAACSSGQEPYSIAMLLRDRFPQLATWDLQIVASDFSSKILARARQGCYSQWEIQRGLPAALREKYFQPQHDGWQIKHEIRQAVEFRQINLLHSWSSMPAMDVIFLQNMLIYFDTEIKKTILGEVKQQLRPDGDLFLGGGETTIYFDDSFERVPCDRGVCHRLQRVVSSE